MRSQTRTRFGLVLLALLLTASITGMATSPASAVWCPTIFSCDFDCQPLWTNCLSGASFWECGGDTLCCEEKTAYCWDCCWAN